MAPNNPVAGFVFSMIPSTLRQSRTSFMKGVGKFQAGAGITGKIAGNGVEFKYTDKDSAVAYMRNRGAPAEVLAALEQDGSVDVTVNGVRIKMDKEQTVEPQTPDANPDEGQKSKTRKKRNNGQARRAKKEAADPAKASRNRRREEARAERKKARKQPGVVEDQAPDPGVQNPDQTEKPSERLKRNYEAFKQNRDEAIRKRAEEAAARKAEEAARKAEEARVEAERARLEQEERARQEEAARKAEAARLEAERARLEQEEAARKAEAARLEAERARQEARVKAEQTTPQDEKVPDNMTTEDIRAYFEKIKNDTSQPNRTKLLLEHPMLMPTRTIKIGDRVFYAGPVIQATTKNGTYLQSIMFTEVNGKLVPRAFYKSNSDGGWRVTPYFGGVYSKGSGIHYTQETKPHEELSHYLENQPVSQEYKGDLIVKYFSFTILNEKGEMQSEPDKGLSEIQTFGGEHTQYDDRGRLDGVREFKPGELNKQLKSREDLVRLEEVTKVENLPDGFVPDFSGAPIRTYEIQHTILTPATGGKITVDVYQGALDGQSVEWHMAHDSQGRVWIDRINFQNDQYNSYGVVSNLINSGILTHKPIEHIEQTDMVLVYPRFKGNFSGYLDITPLLDRMGPIQKFRQQREIRHRNLHRLEFRDVARISDVVAIPDTHGDFEAFDGSLKAHGLIDRRGNWIGGNARVQILGDVFDRGPDAIKILKKIQTLREQGADIDLLVGNHEDWMLNALLAKDPYAQLNWAQDADSEQEQAISSGRAAEYLAKYRDILEIYRYSKIVEQVDDTLYMHGELSDQAIILLEAYGGVDEINGVWQEAVGRAFDGDPTMLEQVSKDFHPFLWSRAISEGGMSNSGGQLLTADPGESGQMEQVLKSMGVNVVVHGHTPQVDGIVGIRDLGGIKIVNADIALSKGMSEDTPSRGGVKITKAAKLSIVDANHSHKTASNQ